MLFSHAVGITLLRAKAPSFLFATTSIELGQMKCVLQPPVQIPMLGVVATPQTCHLRGSLHLGWTAASRKLLGISKAALVEGMEGGIGVVSLGAEHHSDISESVPVVVCLIQCSP